MSAFTSQFLEDSIEILRRVSQDDVDAVVGVLAATRRRGGRLFFVGSGGGAGHASHAACDFRQLAGIESYCVTDNVSELTARINDDGWDNSYADWLRSSRLAAADCLFVFSVGGGDAERNVSTNLVRAIELAGEVGADVVGVVGRDGGTLRRRASASIVIPTVDASAVTAQTEGLQALMWHLIVSHPDVCAATAKWESITDVGASG
jgi:D-sedoheptulose 7-phosphate isomerase